MEPSEFQLRKFVAPEFIFGIDARKLAGRYAKNFSARKVLVVSDPGVIDAGWTDEVLVTLEEAKIPFSIYSSVTSNPKADEVMAGADFYNSEGCNAIVAVGGGSPMDCAKGIGIVTSNHRHVLDFEGVDQVDIPGPPLICIPTTAGSSADVSQFAIITDLRLKTKIAIISKMVVPDVALIDPVTTTTMASDLTAFTGVDALCHAIEAFVSTAHSSITEMHSLKAIDLVMGNLLTATREPENLIVRGRMMLASLHAGLAFSNASLGAVHALAHSLGGFLNCPHGECNSILLPYVIEFNFEAAPERYREIGKSMGLDVIGIPADEVKGKIVSTIRELNRKIGVPPTLSVVGITSDDIPALTEKALKDPCIFTNPRKPTRQEIEAIYGQAL